PQLPPPPTPTLFPYTTLFRSYGADAGIGEVRRDLGDRVRTEAPVRVDHAQDHLAVVTIAEPPGLTQVAERVVERAPLALAGVGQDRKSTRLNSSHVSISYAVF